MKIVVMVARILLGLIFVVFGLNKFFNFIPSPPLPAGLAGQFMGALVNSHYIEVVGSFEAVGGLLLLFNRYVPFGLVLLGPVIVNILLTGILIEPKGLAPGLVVTLLWLVVYWSVRPAFAGIFQKTVVSSQ